MAGPIAIIKAQNGHDDDGHNLSIILKRSTRVIPAARQYFVHPSIQYAGFNDPDSPKYEPVRSSQTPVFVEVLLVTQFGTVRAQ
jgi:hypothetical protein